MKLLEQLQNKNYISAGCTISSNRVHKNGELLFENPNTGISEFLLSVYQHFQFSYPKFYKMDNLSKLGWLAAEILLSDFDKAAYGPEELGVILANKNSSLDNDLRYVQTMADVPSPSVFVYTLPNIVIGEICIRHKFKGEHAFFVQDEFDTDFIAGQVDYLLDNDILQACICGWVDALEQDYKAVLLLAEKTSRTGALPFSAENMDKFIRDNN